MRRNNAELNSEAILVRVVDYHVDDGRGEQLGPFRLFTTLLDPDEVSATELAAAHDADVDPDRVSFTAALRITRRSLSQAGDFSPSRH